MEKLSIFFETDNSVKARNTASDMTIDGIVENETPKYSSLDSNDSLRFIGEFHVKKDICEVADGRNRYRRIELNLIENNHVFLSIMRFFRIISLRGHFKS